MTYDASELSPDAGAPVELYEFTRGVTAWRYTSSDQEESHLGLAYTPVAITRGQVGDMAELRKTELQLSCPRDLDVVAQYIPYPIGEPVTLRIFRRHRTDPDAETRVIWIGKVASVKWSASTAVVTCEPITMSMRRIGLRRRYGRLCQHVLFGRACGVVPADHKTTGSVSAVAANVVTVPAAAGQADGYYAGGYLWWQMADGRRDARMIVQHVGETLTLAAAMSQIAVGDDVDLYPGCDHTIAQCDGRFANSDNYGGFPGIPGVNPFGGTIIY